MLTKVPVRSKVDPKFTWNAESVFKSEKAWKKEVTQILQELPTVKAYQGRLAEGPSVLLEALSCAHELLSRAQKAFMYAGFAYAVDTTNQEAAGRRGQAQGMYGQVISAISFLQPEILSLGKETLDQWLTENKDLAIYRQSFADLFRKQAHVRSAEVEELLGLVSDYLLVQLFR